MGTDAVRGAEMWSDWVINTLERIKTLLDPLSGQWRLTLHLHLVIKTCSRHSSPRCDRISICKCAGQSWWTCRQTESLVHGKICFKHYFSFDAEGDCIM